MGILRRIEHGLVRPALRWMRPARHVVLNGISIDYKAELDGGGIDFGQDFLPFLRSLGNAEATTYVRMVFRAGVHRLFNAGARSLRNAVPS